MKFTLNALAALVIASFGLVGAANACNVTQTGITSHSETDCASASDLQALQGQVDGHDSRLDAHDAALASHGEALEDHADGLAIMAAIANPAWLDKGENFSLSGGWGTFNDHHAIGLTTVIRLQDAWSFNASAGADVGRDAWAARAGVRVGW